MPENRKNDIPQEPDTSLQAVQRQRARSAGRDEDGMERGRVKVLQAQVAVTVVVVEEFIA
jgi:hypothetical protein